MFRNRQRQVLLAIRFDKVVRNDLEYLLSLPPPKLGLSDPPVEGIRCFDIWKPSVLAGLNLVYLFESGATRKDLLRNVRRAISQMPLSCVQSSVAKSSAAFCKPVSRPEHYSLLVSIALWLGWLQGLVQTCQHLR